MSSLKGKQLHRPPVAPLKVPLRPSTTPRSVSFSSHSVFSPLPSPSPTPKPRPRPPESPAWFLLLVFHTLPLYVAHSWFSTHPSSSSVSTTVIFAFLILSSSSITFALLQEKQARTLRTLSITASQWCLLFGNGSIIAFSLFLKIEGVRSCGPLIAIMAEYAGSALVRLILGENSRSSTGSVRGVFITVLVLVLLSQGWTIESCSPLAIKDRLRFFSKTSFGDETGTGTGITTGSGNAGSLSCDSLQVWPPILSGVLSCVVKLASTRTSLRLIPKKRVQGLSSICGTLVVLPLAIFQLDSLFLAHTSALWPLGSMLILGLARSIMGEFYFEDRLLIPAGTSRHLFITLCCSSLLELLFGVDISPLGFLVCSGLLFLAVRELLGTNSAFSWDSIAEQEASDSFIKGPLRHIATDNKSRKIAFFLAMNAAFMVVEFVSGFMSNSLGLISDACHMLFDCAALAIGLYASYISKLQPNLVFSYGYGRFEVLSGYANAVFLVLVGSLIVLESIERILDPPEISTEKLLLVSVGGLLVNVVGLIFFHDEHHHAHHHHHHHETKVEEELSIDLNESHHHEYKATDDHHHHHHHNHNHSDSAEDCNHQHQLHQHHSDHQHSDLQQHSDHHHCSSHDHHDHNLSHHHQDHQQHDHHQHSNHHLANHDHSEQRQEHHHGDDQHHHHHEDHDEDDHHHDDHIDHNMHGIFLHVLADTLGSVGVVISTILIKYKGWVLSDPACSIFISAMIIASAIPLLKNSAEILLQRIPRSAEKRLHAAIERIRHVEGVAGFERLHVWSFTNTEIVGTLHLHAQSSADKSEVRNRVSRVLNKMGITDVTIQVEDF